MGRLFRWALRGLLAIWLFVVASPVVAEDGSSRSPTAGQAEFSGTVTKQVEGRRFEAQVFAKGDRMRLEYKYAIKTELGYSTIEIIRLDQRETWYLLARRKQILAVPVKPEEILPLQPHLPGEQSRTLIGDATTIGRPSRLFEVRVDYNGRNERLYEWVDAETGVVLKLVSQDRDWSVEYQRIRYSP